MHIPGHVRDKSRWNWTWSGDCPCGNAFSSNAGYNGLQTRKRLCSTLRVRWGSKVVGGIRGSLMLLVCDGKKCE